VVGSTLESVLTTRRHYDHKLAVDALEEVNNMKAKVGRCVAGRDR
jgi:hypothetical protein